MSDELMRCRFCGGKGSIEPGDSTDREMRHKVICRACLVRTADYGTIAEATAAWNRPPACTWTIDTDSYGEVEVWNTGCDHGFFFDADGPRANGFRFCPYCGRELVEVWPKVEEEEE